MKLYCLDQGWNGAAICVAETKEKALQKIIESEEWCEELIRANADNVQEYDLDSVVITKGDCW